MTLALIILGIPILSYKINRSITNQAQECDLIETNHRTADNQSLSRTVQSARPSHMGYSALAVKGARLLSATLGSRQL